MHEREDDLVHFAVGRNRPKPREKYAQARHPGPMLAPNILEPLDDRLLRFRRRLRVDPADSELQPASKEHALGLGQEEGFPEFRRLRKRPEEGLAGFGQAESLEDLRLDA